MSFIEKYILNFEGLEDSPLYPQYSIFLEKWLLFPIFTMRFLEKTKEPLATIFVCTRILLLLNSCWTEPSENSCANLKTFVYKRIFEVPTQNTFVCVSETLEYIFLRLYPQHRNNVWNTRIKTIWEQKTNFMFFSYFESIFCNLLSRHSSTNVQ